MKQNKLFIGLLLVFFLKQLFWLAIIPPTQAPDEYAHLSYVESWYYEGRLPKLGETLITKRIEEASQSTSAGADSIFNKNTQSQLVTSGLANAQKLEYQPGGQLNWIAQHPPVYYSLLKIFYPLVAEMDVNIGIFWLRISSVVLGLLTIIFTYLIVEIISKKKNNSQIEENYLPLLVAGFLAFLPDFSFISAVLNNDNLVLCLSSGLIYMVTELATSFKGKSDRKLYINGSLIAALIGLLLITKATSLPVVAATVLFEIYFLVIKKRLHWLDLVKFFFMQFAIIMPMSSWWYIHNYYEFHVFLPDIATVIQIHPEILTKHAYFATLFPEVTGAKNLISPYEFFITKNFFWNYFINIWGVFGAGFITLGAWQIGAYIMLIMAATVGYISQKLKRRLSPEKLKSIKSLTKLVPSSRSNQGPLNFYFILITVILFGAITYKLFQIAQSRGFLGAMHGRYFLPAMIPIGYWIFSGIQRLFKNRQNSWVVASLFLFFIVNEIVTIVTVIIPSFY